MDLGIKGRVAFVAASSKGLGRAAAEALAADGVRLALCSRQAEKLTETAEQIRARCGVGVFAEPVEVTALKAVTTFFG